MTYLQSLAPSNMESIDQGFTLEVMPTWALLAKMDGITSWSNMLVLNEDENFQQYGLV